MQKIIVVIPCYNEQQRLKELQFSVLLERPGIEIVFVNDGSSDGTASALRAIEEHSESRVHVLDFAENAGKAEAVRRGMLYALSCGAQVVGYMDADASTPPREMLRLLEVLEARAAEVVLGARVQLLGNDVQRHPYRHYLGRVFASAASLLLVLPVYDTQCGAKFFRDSVALRRALAAPFRSRWVFDVELLGRLVIGSSGTAPLARESFVEVPLQEWRDVPGSKLRASSMLKSGIELLVIGAGLRRQRARQKRRA